MKRLSLVTAAVLAAALVGCNKKPDSPPVTPPVPKTASTTAPVAAASQGDDAIAWRRDDVDAAFAEARSTNKPVFLYWGATWCPPCNQMKATLFQRRDFVERTERFIPVYVDGDTPAAQKLATRFSVTGYPTMVLFKPDGTEITRLPGEADPEHYLQVLTLGMSSARPVRATLKMALADGKGLDADDWRMLAWYSWDTDDAQLVPAEQVGATLKTLASHCPADAADARTRLILKTAASAGAAAAKGKPVSAAGFDRRQALAATEALLASPAAARNDFDVVSYGVGDIARATTEPGSAERQRLVAAADAALARLATDASLSNTERLDATTARVELARLDVKEDASVALPDALLGEVRQQVTRADRESRNPYERQTVINAAAGLLTAAGLLDESDALLKAELSRSHSPYYFMLDLAANAKKRGDKAGAIAWTAKAWDGAKGPATRLQWGATYVATLIDLVPDDATRIERVTTSVIDEVDPDAASFDGRNRKSLSRMASKVDAWNARGAHADEAARIAAASRSLCGRLAAGSDERTRCGELLKVRLGATGAFT